MKTHSLKRQLNLAQIVMLGAAGTIGAQIFVLTGHTAGLVGPATLLALLIGGLLSYSVALNYCELATAFPVTGGAMTYVREAWGNNILSFLVGSMDCLSSTFYCALSAVGFAYSLQVFLPQLPVVPVALAVIVLFTVLNGLGVTRVGNVQILLGAVLLILFGVYIVFGLLGFSSATLLTGGRFFIAETTRGNSGLLLQAIALVYVAYVGFEVIADDAEEVANPSRNIPRGILISLTLVIVIYILVALVTLGNVPWPELAGSETALTDAVQRFMPPWGLPLMALAGLIATLTSINTSMLSATREAFTLARDGVWPRSLARLSRYRTPTISILLIGIVSALVASIGAVDFLAYISSAGYLFVLFFASLAMIRLRRRMPNIARPFRVPFFPLTAVMAGFSCILILAFSDVRALGFGALVLALCAVYYYARGPVSRWARANIKAARLSKDRLLVAAANPATAANLMRLAAILAESGEDTSVCLLSVQTRARAARGRQAIPLFLRELAGHYQGSPFPVYLKTRGAADIAQGVLDELEHRRNVQLVLTGWPGPVASQKLAENPVKVLLQKAHTNVGVYLDHGLGAAIHRILVPVGGGPHSRFALRLADAIARAEDARVTALHIVPPEVGSDELENEMIVLQQIVDEELGAIPRHIKTRLRTAATLPAGLLDEIGTRSYDLVVMGASEEWMLNTRLFGAVDDWIADRVPCSLLLVRSHEAPALAWLRRQVKRMEKQTSPDC